MRNVQILPIFNQTAPGVWDDFLRIRVAVMKYNYDHELDNVSLNNALTELANNWKTKAWNFAFGAYDNNKMIGYICGHADKKDNGQTVYFDHLYVMPEYQKQHIGKQLLNAAESASALHARQSELISLGNAYGFYAKNGYVSYTGTNVYNKSLKNIGKCQVIPVFYCKPKILGSIKDMISNTKSKIKSANTEHKPMFVYKDINLKTTGVMLGDAIHTLSEHADDWAKKQLIKKQQLYLTQQNTK